MEASKEVVVKSECHTCEGTGIDLDNSNKEGRVGMACMMCEGSGYRVITYIPFMNKNRLPGIERVVNWQSDPRGSNFTRSVSYEEFMMGEIPSYVEEKPASKARRR